MMRPYSPHVLARVWSLLQLRDRLADHLAEVRTKALLYSLPAGYWLLPGGQLEPIPSEYDRRWEAIVRAAEEGLASVEATLEKAVESSAEGTRLYG